MDQKKKKLRSLTRIFLLWGILFLLLPGCRTNIAARSDTQEKTLRNREILVGKSLLEAFRKNDFTALTGILAAYGGPIPARKDFLHSQKEFSKQFGEMISYCYLTDLETPLFRNCLFIVTLERKGENDRKIRQELLFRLVMTERGRNGKPQIVGMGFF